MTLSFSAPWSPYLYGTSVVLAGVGAYLWMEGSPGARSACAVLGGAVALAAAVTVTGYAVEPGAVVVRRPGRETRLDLRGLTSVEADPSAMRWAWRVFGFSGPFAFVGWFWKAGTGLFRAFATDRARAVVLRWPDRTVLVSPDDPATFVAAVEAAAERVPA